MELNDLSVQTANMFPFSDHPEQALVELESFLDQVPQDADSKLLELSSWIERLDRTQDYGVAEKAVKLIGTAVGVQRMRYSRYSEIRD